MEGLQEPLVTTRLPPPRPESARPAETCEIDVADVLGSFHDDRLAGARSDAGRPLVRRIPGRPEDVVVSPCPICGDIWSRPLFEIEGCENRLVVCTDCGLGRLWPLPDPDVLSSLYRPDYYGAAGAKFRPLVERVVRGIAASRARRLVRGLPPGARVLDVGCGRGVLLGALADRGCEVHGFDISETATAGADARAQLRHAGDLAAAGYAANSFHQVILCHVLEHLPRPQDTLLEIRRILKPGGRLTVAVPNFSSLQAQWSGVDWFHLDLPRHLYHFPLPALTQLVEGCGLSVNRVQHFAFDQNVFGWLQSVLNRFSPSAPNRLYGLLKNAQVNPDEAGASAPRWRALTAGALLAPVALFLSVLEPALRRGGTVTLTATKKLRTQSARPETAEAPAWSGLLAPKTAMSS